MQLIEGIMLYLTRPLWDYTLKRRGQAYVVIETIASVSTGGGTIATVTPHIMVSLHGTSQHRYLIDYSWAYQYIGVSSRLKYWKDFRDWRRDPWEVLRQVVQAHAKHGGDAGVVTEHLKSKEELIEDVRDALARVTHAMLYYRTTHDHEAFKVLTPRLSPWTCISETPTGDSVTQENVHKLVTFNREGGRRWVEETVGSMVRIEEVRCFWDHPPWR